MTIHRLDILLFVTFSLIVSCVNGNGSKQANDREDITLKHAKFLTLQKGEGYTYAEIRNPWDSAKTLHRYVMIEKGKEKPDNLPEGDIIEVPLARSLYYTSIHVSLANELGAYSSVAGVGDAKYMYLPRIQDDIKANRITDCGDSNAPNIERIINLSPDAIFVSPFETSGSYGKLGNMHIPLIECADYMEISALGRAEWIRFFGILLGRQHEADSIFTAVEKDYNALKALAMTAKTRPTVFSEKKYGASWYVAGANSTIGELFADAGAEYVFKDEKSTGSVPYSPEVVFDRCQDASFWLLKYSQDTDITYEQLSSEWPNYSKLKAFTSKNIYACNLSKTSYYEETPFHPNILLRDYVKIFHPELLNGYTLRYYKKI